MHVDSINAEKNDVAEKGTRSFMDRMASLSKTTPDMGKKIK